MIFGGSHHGSAKLVSLEGAEPVFARVRAEAEASARREPEIAGWLYATVLNHERLEFSDRPPDCVAIEPCRSPGRSHSPDLSGLYRA